MYVIQYNFLINIQGLKCLMSWNLLRNLCDMLFSVNVQLSKRGCEEFQCTNSIIAIVSVSGKLHAGNVGGENTGEWAWHNKVPLPFFQLSSSYCPHHQTSLVCALLTNASCCRYGTVSTGAHESSLRSVQDPNSTFLFNLKSLAGSHGRKEGRKYLQFCQGAWNSSQDTSELDGTVEYQELIPNAKTIESLPNQSERGQENKANSGAVKICNIELEIMKFYEHTVRKVIGC